MNPKVDAYLEKGCGRCELFATPACKVNEWREVMVRARKIVLDCSLTEELKWGVACYTFEGNNVLVLSALKKACILGFFKGALLQKALQDSRGVLRKPGKHSQAVRQIHLTRVQAVDEMEPFIRACIKEAIEVEKAGLQVDFKAKHELVYPEELKAKFEELPALETAFEALTPGKKRGYILHFTGAKQSKTRAARVERCMQKIFDGKGFNERDG